jgi:hypothetical protein
MLLVRIQYQKSQEAESRDWNATVLQATKVDARVGVESFSDGVLHESSNSPPIFIAENNLTQSEGEYMLDVTSMAPAPSFSGSGNIVKITFNAINVGSSALSLQSQLYDYPPTDRDPRISLAIDHTTQDSSVTVKEATTVTTPSNTPTASATPSSSTATATPILSTPTQTPKPQQIENLGLDFVLPLAVTLVAVLIAVSALTAYRRRKMR